MASKQIKITGLRASYPHLFSPDKMAEKYTCTFILPKNAPGVAELKASLNEVYKAAVAENPGKTIAHDILKDGDLEKAADQLYAGCYFFKAKTGFDSIKDNVFKRTPMGVVKITDESEFYAGCNCSALVTVKDYDFNGKRGLHFLLEAVCREEGGEPLSSGSSSHADAFEQTAPAATPSDDVF